MAHAEIAAFMADLRRHEDIAARALEFAILTACRTGEVVGAKWDEINFADRKWMISGDRMKAGREHRVPLSSRALEILEALPREGEHVFPNSRGKPLSNTVAAHIPEQDHGMRRDGARVSQHVPRLGRRLTNFPSEVAEAALAHVVGNKVAQAYQRTDLLERRRKLMDAWASCCAGPPVERGVVLPLRG